MANIIRSQYRDLGEIINVTNMAAGAYAWSDWIDDVDWVRNHIAIANSDQQYDVVVIRKDKQGKGTLYVNGIAVNNTPAERVFPSTGANGLLGYSVRFGIKNSSASANTFAKLSVQLMGS